MRRVVAVPQDVVVAGSAQNTTTEARNAAESASDLSRMAASLGRLVGEFHY